MSPVSILDMQCECFKNKFVDSKWKSIILPVQTCARKDIFLIDIKKTHYSNVRWEMTSFSVQLQFRIHDFE